MQASQPERQDTLLPAAKERNGRSVGRETAPLGSLGRDRKALEKPHESAEPDGGGPSANNDETLKQLFATTGLSVLLSTGARAFLRRLTAVERRGDAAAVADGTALRRWWGDGGDGTEQLAGAFEAYLLKGTALPAGPREALRHFRAWLIGLYVVERQQGVAVSAEVADVFDRLLAVELALAEARRTAGDVGPVSPDLQEKRTAADAEAEDRLTREILRPVRAAREKGYRQELAGATAEAEGRINALPVYRATEWLTNRRWLGEEMPALPTIRLSRPILVERYGEAVLAALPRGRFTAHAATGGVDPDEAAGLFGFSSGDEMIQAMALVPKREATIALEAKRLMVEQLGDPLVDGTLPGKALAAIHGPRMAEWLAAELKALAGPAGEAKPVTAEGAAAFARDALVDTPVRGAIDARHHLVAERRAGEEVAKFAASSGEDRAKKLYDARRRQLLNLALYAEAVRIADDLKAAEEMVRRLDQPERPEVTIGVDGWPAIDAILDRFEFRKTDMPAPRNAVATFVKAMTAAGRDNEMALADLVLRGGEGKPYRELPIGALTAVVASLRNIEHAMGRNDALVDGRGRQRLSEAAKGIATALARVNGGAGKRPVDLGRAAEEVLREIDGRAKGPAFAALKAPVDAAVAALKARRQRAAEEVAALYAPYEAGERRAMAVRRFLPALGRSLSRWEMIAVALNAGTEAGHAALTGPAGFSPEMVSAILAALDTRDARFIQSVWDHLESFRDEIAVRERRATGAAPKWSEARPVSVGGVALTGGVYPLAMKGDLAEGVRAGRFAKAMAGGDGEDGAVGLDLTLFHAFVDRLLHDLELSEAVTNARRLLAQPELHEAFTGKGRADDLETLAAWLDAVAAGDLRLADFHLRMASAEGGEAVARQLARDLAAALTDAAGLPEAIKAVGAASFAVGASGAFVDGIADRIAERSPLMAGRRLAAAKRGEAGPDDLAAWLIRRVRWHFVEVPVWLSGYGHGLARSGGDARAVAEGDGWVRKIAVPDGKAEAAVKTLVAALMASSAVSEAAGLTRTLGATLLFARQKMVLAAARSGEGAFGLLGTAPGIGDAASTAGEGAARAAMWAKSGGRDGAGASVMRSAMMAAALMIDAPAEVAIGHTFGAMT